MTTADELGLEQGSTILASHIAPVASEKPSVAPVAVASPKVSTRAVSRMLENRTTCVPHAQTSFRLLEQ
jgi:hypothetical protein